MTDVTQFIDACRAVDLETRAIADVVHVWNPDALATNCGARGYTKPAHRAKKVCMHCRELPGRETRYREVTSR